MAGVQDNLTAVLYGIEDLRLEQRPIPKISSNEVLLRMDCVGICGSDVHYLVHGRIADFVLDGPMITGHEASGVVAEVGTDVTHLKVGDRVAVEPTVPCRICEFCKGGRYNLCPDGVFCTTPPHNGNLTRYYAHAADFCYKLPDHVSMEEAALLEPLSVGVHACHRAGMTFGSTVLIQGAGPIGLNTLLAAKAFGATNVLITDLVESKLQKAKSIGADHTLKVDKSMSEEELVRQIHTKLGCAPDKSIDCSGFESTIRSAILATRTGGTVAIVGHGSDDAKIPVSVARELEIKGVCRYVNEYPLALSMVASGTVNVKPLLTHHFDIEQTDKAFEVARSGAEGVIKVMIHVQPRNTNNKIKI